MKHTSTEAQWRALIAEQEASGQSIRDFAEERGVSAWSLYGWRSRLGVSRGRSERRRAKEDGSEIRAVEADLVAVDVVGPGTGQPAIGGWDFALEIGGDLVVQVRHGFDGAELSRLVTILRSSC